MCLSLNAGRHNCVPTMINSKDSKTSNNDLITIFNSSECFKETIQIKEETMIAT